MTIKASLARFTGASLLALMTGIASAQAGTVVGLTADGKLVTIDTAAMTASAPMAVSGDRLVGIDVRPADGKLYGVSINGQIVTVDPKTGATTKVSMISEKVTMGDRPVVDFNPAADRLRVIAAGGVSLRINVETGATIVDKPLSFDPADANASRKPAVVAGAYTNALNGAKATDLFHIDGGTGAWVLQSPPNDGILKTRGAIGVANLADAVVDIATEGEKNTAWMIAGGTLYTIDIASGKATSVGAIKGISGKLIDIAVWQ
ncbi:MAG: DUF4394 domain-containing protein [Alphaproteobacteria bacterium]|nr:DUF4394 domain-containing protein [Alphaproteobacteria bacterium]MCW5741855.1 DUF4394 domain-containing protein [Alphaproteobacteria bacterium]